MSPAPNPWPRGDVYKVNDGEWFVASRSEPGAFWHVVWHYAPREGHWWSCTCPAGRDRERMGHDRLDVGRPCFHVGAAIRAEMDDGYPPRPAAGRFDPGAFVD